jgi:predicted acetyltransferase
MVKVEFISIENRIKKRKVIETVSNAIFGSTIEIEFSEQFIPSRGKVPIPKVSNFTTYLINVPKYFWVVYYEEIIVGFVLISDFPHQNSIGFGINYKFAQMGIISSAWELIKFNQCIEYPLYAITSKRNTAALNLLKKLGFQYTNKNILFGNELSLKYILNQ